MISVELIKRILKIEMFWLIFKRTNVMDNDFIFVRNYPSLILTTSSSNGYFNVVLFLNSDATVRIWRKDSK